MVVLPASTEKSKILDCRDQFYTPEEIKIMLSTEANKCLFDFNHNNKRLKGIHTIENYRAGDDEYVNNVKILKGSWMKKRYK